MTTTERYIKYKRWVIEQMTEEINKLERSMTKQDVKSDEAARLRALLGSPLKPHTEQSVALEAHTLVHGNRGEAYGHPLDDMTRTAGMLNALLGPKLNVPLQAEDVSKIMVLVKLSREENRPKRDNRVDGAGYFETLDMIVAERARREGGTYA